MKIRELRFKNLNSLYGEWHIDFTHPEYTANGIFALTGPTGAGKSTILDAICLALYGTTPRLGKITQSSNEIMSRQTGDCWSEVIFESQAGRFRCHWGQHRARKKPDGNLIDARHEISEIDTKKPIETKKSLVPGIVEEKTGMDYERFTRSILLAQGGFDTFLKAGVEQKSKILEQITGTHIYTQISKQVYDRQRDENKKLELLKAGTSGIVMLTPEQEEKIKQDLADKQKQETDLADRFARTSKSVTWLIHIEEIRKEINALSEMSDTLQKELDAFKPDREKLVLATKAAALEGAYAAMTTVRKQLDEDQAALKNETRDLPKLEGVAVQYQKDLKTAEQKTRQAKSELKTAAPILMNVRALDQRLADQKKNIQSMETDCRKAGREIKKDQNRTAKIQQGQDRLSKQFTQVTTFLEKHASDEWLLAGLAGVEEQLGTLASKQNDIQKKTDEKQSIQKALKKISQEQNDTASQIQTQKQTLTDIVISLEQEKETFTTMLEGRLLREFRTELETLHRERVFLERIVKLEEHRKQLEDGKACPLCGAKEHPFARGNVPAATETDRKIEKLSQFINTAEKKEAAIKKIETREKEARAELTQSEKHEAAVIGDQKAAKSSLTGLTDALKQLAVDFKELRQAVLMKLSPLGIVEMSGSGAASLITSLKTRQKKWQEAIQEKQAVEKQITDLNSEIKQLEAAVTQKIRTLAEKQTALDSARQTYSNNLATRQELFGSRNPDTEETRLNKAVTRGENAEKKTDIRCQEALQTLNAARARISSLKDRIEKGSAESAQLTSSFNEQLEPAGFIDEKHFRQSRLSTENRQSLLNKEKDLDNQKIDLDARLKDRKDRLQKEMSKNLSDKSLEPLSAESAELEKNLKQIRDAIAGLNHTLTENKKAQKRLKEKQKAIHAQEKECLRWQKLNQLIGSADGKKYRNFAQGLTFELMVSHANQQLQKMTDRYLLIRDKVQPLALNVMDNYQAGEIRTIKNLSGGESFIVSLTLALGLSKMASRKVRVDSLFLDEGFGTLDDEALETALETLSSLHQGGKLLGIISHVSALKERISTQITVNPRSGGKSLLTGPGCCKVEKSA